MSDPALPPPSAREARRAVLRRRVRRSVAFFALVPVAAALHEVPGLPQAVEVPLLFALMAAFAAWPALRARTRRGRERARERRDAYLADVRAAARALTPAERA